MEKLDLLNLENRRGKAPGGYQESLELSRLPFIFMNAVGTNDDVRTLLHESGHSFNTFAAQAEWLSNYRHPPLEFAEVASMGMELLTIDFFGEFYGPEDAKRAKEDKLEDIIGLLCWIATIDAFQHWLYTNPDHTVSDRRENWDKVSARFATDVDWSGLEKYRQTLWHRQLHVFEHPFYYIEYGIAQLGALQLWQNAKKDYSKTVGEYKKALSLGGSVALPELFQTAGIKFQFDRKIIVPLVKTIAEELNLK